VIVALRGYNTYFDSSRAAGDAEVVVGGLLSTVEEWEQFEISWRLTLAKFDVPYFHMREFNSHSSRGAFKHPKWRTESYRAEFMSHLTQIMRGWAAACIVSSIKKQTFDKYNAAYAVDERFTMFSLCARDCVAHTRKFIKENGNPELPTAYIFDRGDEGEELLRKEMVTCGYPAPVFKRSRPDLKHPEIDKEDPFHVQLQACDLAAWEVRRGENDYVSGVPTNELRKSLLALAPIRRIWVETREPDMEGLIQVAKIRKRKRK
jgi:hypothetical protein